MRVRSESSVHFIEKRTKELYKGKTLQISFFLTRLSTKLEFNKVRKLYYGLESVRYPLYPFGL